MIFFNPEAKRLAEKLSSEELLRRYEAGGERLVRAARNGSFLQMRKEIKRHHQYENALLYRDYVKYRQCRK